MKVIIAEVHHEIPLSGVGFVEIYGVLCGCVETGQPPSVNLPRRAASVYFSLSQTFLGHTPRTACDCVFITTPNEYAPKHPTLVTLKLKYAVSATRISNSSQVVRDPVVCGNFRGAARWVQSPEFTSAMPTAEMPTLITRC